MKVPHVEDVEEGKVSFDAYLAVGCVRTSDQLCVSLSWICRWKEALIKDEFRNEKANRIVGLCPNFWVIHVGRVLIDTYRQIFPDKRVTTNLPFKQVRMIAYFTELHHQVHQVLHLLLVLLVLEQVLRTDLILDPLI